MSGKDGGWILPDVIDPTRVCVQLWIPNDFHHLAAFWGALYELTRWYNWQRDDNKTGKKAADVWYEIWRLANDRFYAGHGCSDMPQTLLRMDQQCGTLQVSYDDGAHWVNVVDIGSCISAGVNAGIQQAVSDGTIAAPGQAPASGAIPAAECRTWDITLRGNTRWHSPSPVQAGYTITVTNARGGWGEAPDILSQWGCPNGTGYALGHCGQPIPTQPTDPLQTQPHLRLIGYCNAIYMDMYNTAYTVPQGTPSCDFFLQPNDGNISDNPGEIQLTVTICNTAPGSVVCEVACDPNSCNGTGPFGTLGLHQTYTFHSTHSTFFCTQERLDIYFHNAVDITVTWPPGHQPGCANWAWYSAGTATSNQTASWTGINHGTDLKTTFTSVMGMVFGGPDGIPFSVDITIDKVYP